MVLLVFDHNLYNVEGNDIDSQGTVVTVVTKVGVAVVFMVVVICSSLEVGGPPFNNGTCSSTTLGSLIVSFLTPVCCSTVDGITSSII